MLSSGVPAIKEIGLSNFIFGKEWKPSSNIYGIFNMKMCIRDRFIGLPCQVAGVKNFINKSLSDKLYTIDSVSYTHLDVYKRQAMLPIFYRDTFLQDTDTEVHLKFVWN